MAFEIGHHDFILESLKILGLQFELKCEQKSAITNVLAGRDVFGVLPTGYGKSIIYILLPVCADLLRKPDMGHIVLVISPLISLMEDQLASISTYGLPAACISENQKNDEIKSDVRKGIYPIVLLSPESLFKGRWRDILFEDVYQRKLCAIVVDEAHCVAEWGKTFRTDYQRINELRALVPKVPILALTATASPQNRIYIKERLNMNNSEDIVITADRPNITYFCLKANYDAKICFQWLIQTLKEETSNAPKCIIYCRSIASVATVYDILMNGLDKDAYVGISAYQNCLATMFHRSTILRIKQHVIKTFVRSDSILRVVVATAAFGMGVNVPDVKYVLHWGASRTIESFFQESGRAGRQGHQASSIVYFHPTDVSLRMTDKTMSNYCKQVTMCRREILVEYFTPKHPSLVRSIAHFCCDVCRLKCMCGHCPPEIAMLFDSSNENLSTTPTTIRDVTQSQRDSARTQVVAFREEYESTAYYLPTGVYSGLDEETIDNIISNMEYIGDVDDLISNYSLCEEVSSKVLEILEQS